MNQEIPQPTYAELILEELLNQNTMLSRDLAMVKAELQLVKRENESLKRLQQNDQEIQ